MPAEDMVKRRLGLKSTIAALASAIVASPERCIAERAKEDDANTHGRPRVAAATPLQNLQQLCGDPDPVIRKLAMLSCVAIFRDVAPGYRVRLPTAAEASARVRKDLRKLRAFEAALLAGYQRFLKYLEATAAYGEAAGRRLHLSTLSASDAAASGGADLGVSGAGAPSRFENDQSAADKAGQDDEGDGFAGSDQKDAEAKPEHGVGTRDWNARKMTLKRDRIAQRDNTTVYEADDDTVRSLGLAALQVRGPRPFQDLDFVS
jgi:hypothetical protein